jgi:hypothetical protein
MLGTLKTKNLFLAKQGFSKETCQHRAFAFKNLAKSF